MKIRGYGVDLVEVQKALISHSAVKEAVVTAQPSEDGSARLVAYFTSDGQQVPTVSELRRYLKDKLPDYMIPAGWVNLQRIPLTSSNKLDRNALPASVNLRPHLDTVFVGARTTEERQLTKIWSEVLGIDEVGIHDNFFDLGGHSLAASRIISRIFRELRLDLPVKALFDSPTVAAMAQVIVTYGSKPLGDLELDKILENVESISEEDAKQLVSERLPPNPKI